MHKSLLSRNMNYLGLLAANTILGAALPMTIIMAGLAGLTLAPTTALATLPASLSTLAGFLAAAPFSLTMGRYGRKTGFALGGSCAVLGSLLGVWALFSGSFMLLCVSHFALGAALACYQYFRFAAAEVVSADWRPVAISLILTSGLVAALIGPQIFIWAKDALAPVPLAGAYLALAVVSLAGLIPLAFTKLPKPAIAAPQSLKERFASLSVLKRGPIRRAVALGAVSQGVMVFLMVPTPLAMISSGFSEAVAGDVIRWHVVAMFAPSFFTGFLIKRFGVNAIATTGLAILGLSSLGALSGVTATQFYASLILLGIGWNFSFIAATTLLTEVVTEREKALVQGANDTVIALVSTVCAFAAGAIIAGFGWAMLAGCALVVVLCASIFFVRDIRKPS